MSKLTRSGARELTSAIDRIASAVQENPALLGIDPKIAKDFAYRCDLISDAIETTAVTNFPKSAGDFDAEEIGEVESGPVESLDEDHGLEGHFTQQESEQLSQIVEKLASVLAESKRSKPAPKSASKKSVSSHGFNLTK